MAENSLLKEIIIRAKTEGVEDSSDAVEVLRVAIDAVGASAGLSTRELAGLEKAVNKVDGASTRTTPGVRQMSSEFKAMVKEANALDVALREAAQSMVSSGDNNFLSGLAAGMTDAQAEEHAAVRKAEKLTADQVIAERNRVKREKEKLAQQEAKIYNDYLEKQYAAEKRATSEKERLAQQQNKIYNDYLEKQYAAEKAAADKILAEVRRVHAERQKLNAEAARIQQRAFTDPKSFFGQANSAEQSAGLKASETSWAKAAQQRGTFLKENEKLVASSRQEELAYMRAVMQSKWAVDESSDSLLKQGDAAQKSSEGYIALRYALYDVSRTALVASAAIAGVGVATIKSFADTESGFSALERTSGLYGDALTPLRDELLELSRILPVATADIQSFATRGAQLGIPTDSITDFTETIAKFVATSPEVDINSVAEAFGRISNLTGSEDFTALASSIALVGVNAAATDQQIIKTTQEFARAAATTSLTADEIIGISAAFASLGVQPEAARGVANQFFTQLSKGAAGLNESMAVAAQMMGVTEQAAASLFKTDTGTFFQNFVTGLSNVDDVTLALNNMGLEGARLGPAFSALAKNTRENAAGQSILSRAMADANQGFRERIELDRQFAPIADDVNSKVLLIANAFRALAFDIGQQLAPTLGFALDGIKNLINGLSDFIQTPVGESIVRMVATLSGLAIVAGGLVAILAGVAASGLAVRFALQQIAGSGFVAAFSGIANAIRGIGIASATSAGLAVALGNALKYVGRVTIIGAALYALSELIFNTGDALQWIGGVLVEFTNFLFEAARNINSFFGGVEVIATSGGFTQTVNDWGKGLKSFGASLGSTNSKVSDFSAGQLGLNGLMDEFGSSIAPGATDAAGDYGDAVGGAAQEVRTLLDYSGDLAKVWDRAFEIRFSGQSTLDAVTSSFISIREAADAAAKRIRDLNNDIAKLNSDINIQEYFLSIAIEYGDTKRAEAIEAELAKKRAELADKTLELQNQQDAANKSLVGNSKAAIDNRKQITDLVKQYQGHIQALAASGMSQDQLAQATARLKQDFINQATQLGYNRGELEMYAKAFDDVAVAISKVPRNITVSANADPAIQAFNEYEAALNRARANASRGVPAVSMPVTGYVDKGARDALFAAWVQDMRRIHGVNLAQSPAGWADVRRKWDAGVWGQFAQGGYTGAGGKYEPAGIVHKGEYVIPKHMVNQSTGLPYADALGRLARGVGTPTSYAQGGYVNPPTQTAMHIAPGSIEALANAVSKVLVVDGKVLADSSARVYGNETVTGSF